MSDQARFAHYTDFLVAFVGALGGLAVGLLLLSIAARCPFPNVETAVRCLVLFGLHSAFSEEWFWVDRVAGFGFGTQIYVSMAFASCAVWTCPAVAHPSVYVRFAIHSASVGVVGRCLLRMRQETAFEDQCLGVGLSYILLLVVVVIELEYPLWVDSETIHDRWLPVYQRLVRYFGDWLLQLLIDLQRSAVVVYQRCNVDFQEYYAESGLEPTADDRTIQRRFRQLLRPLHPDVTRGLVPGATEISSAWGT